MTSAGFDPGGTLVLPLGPGLSPGNNSSQLKLFGPLAATDLMPRLKPGPTCRCPHSVGAHRSGPQVRGQSPDRPEPQSLQDSCPG